MSLASAQAARERRYEALLRFFRDRITDPEQRYPAAQKRKDAETLRRFERQGGALPPSNSRAHRDLVAILDTAKQTTSPEAWDRFVAAVRRRPETAPTQKSGAGESCDV